MCSSEHDGDMSLLLFFITSTDSSFHLQTIPQTLNVAFNKYTDINKTLQYPGILNRLLGFFKCYCFHQEWPGLEMRRSEGKLRFKSLETKLKRQSWDGF